MNGIDKIIERILDTANLERDRILSDAGVQAKEIYSSLKDVADAEALETVNRGKEQARIRIERAAGSSDQESRRMLLDTKQKMIDKAFERAKILLLQLPDEEYTSLLAKLASQALITGKEEIILGETDLNRYEAAIRSKINKLASERGLPAEVTVSQSGASFDGGLIVRQGNIETNCTFDTILRMLRDNIVGDVAEVLFV